mmetsp:Transcript_27269/g.31168  ORF Transcript_27269/g.31168 Transcript_27269/m.31168 type:complete len:221 (+) Transcript_27269:287-949(+)
MSTQHKVWKILSATCMITPPIILFKDSFYSIHTVQDDSMDPFLQRDDIVLIRKVDFLPHYRKHGMEIKDLQETKEDHNTNTKIDEETDRIKSQRMDIIGAGKAPSDALTFWSGPPHFLPGDVVAFKCPQVSFPAKIQMKRLVGLGGQRIRPIHSYHKIENIPPYSLWVENDNLSNEEDSRKFGAISKKLTLGQVECIIWPSSRWNKIERIRPAVGRAWWP